MKREHRPCDGCGRPLRPQPPSWDRKFGPEVLCGNCVRRFNAIRINEPLFADPPPGFFPKDRVKLKLKTVSLRSLCEEKPTRTKPAKKLSWGAFWNAMVKAELHIRAGTHAFNDFNGFAFNVPGHGLLPAARELMIEELKAALEILENLGPVPRLPKQKGKPR